MWAGIAYDGKWKVLHYVARNIYRPVIIASYWKHTMEDLAAYVTSDLWDEVEGQRRWLGMVIMGLFRSTNKCGLYSWQAEYHTSSPNRHQLIFHSLANAILKMNMSATTTGVLPNMNTSRVFKHESVFHSWQLQDVKLQDLGLVVGYDNSTGSFTVEATKAVATWVWLDIPAGALGNFEENGLWLLPGDGTRCGREGEE